METTRDRPWLLASLVGLIGIAINLLWLTNPVPWRDEGATWIANQRSLPALWSLLGQVDAVHGLYYFIMRAWTHLFGSSILSMRLVSVIAVGVGAAMVFLLVRQFEQRWVAFTAGVVYASLPQITAAAADARSYALSTAVGVAAMACFWRATTTNRTKWWIAFVFAAALSVHLFLFLSFIYLAIPIALIWQLPAVRLRGYLSCLAAGVLCIPIGLVAMNQSEQVDWIMRHKLTFVEIFQGAFWGHSWVAWLGSALLIAALVNAVLLFRNPANRSLVTLLVGWLLLPTLVLLLLSLHQPAYTEAYVTCSAPALAILVALLIRATARAWARVIVVLTVATIGAVGLWTNRQPEIHSTALEAVNIIAAESSPGDGVYIAGKDRHVLWWAFPAQMDGLVNLSRKSGDEWKWTSLKEPSRRIDRIPGRLAKVDRLWLFADKDRLDDRVTQLEANGFTVVKLVKTKDYPVTLVLMERTG